MARVQRVGGGPPFPLPVLDHPLVQVDVWGGPKATALKGAEAIRSVLMLRLPYILPGTGTLGPVNQMGSLRYFPDLAFDPAKPRYIFDATFSTRP
jgi:hypothetical protein